MQETCEHAKNNRLNMQSDQLSTHRGIRHGAEVGGEGELAEGSGRTYDSVCHLYTFLELMEPFIFCAIFTLFRVGGTFSDIEADRGDRRESSSISCESVAKVCRTILVLLRSP